MIYFNIQIDTFKLKNKAILKKWLKECIVSENHKLEALNYHFVSDEVLLVMNKKYLNHDTYTDIITFDMSEKDEYVSGEIYISIDRIKENAEKFKVNFETELRRVLVHGVLHLCGYGDKTKADKTMMTSKEDFYLETYGTL